MGYLIKQNASLLFPVVLFEQDHATELTGVTIGNVTVYAAKSDGSSGTVTPSSWTEVDGTNMPGLYMLGLSSSVTNLDGPLVIYVKGVSGLNYSDYSKREVYVSTSLVDDVETSVTTAQSALTSSVNTAIDHSLSARRILEGKWTIDTVGNQLVMYIPDGSGGWTEYRRFNMFDKNGSVTSDNPYSRIPTTQGP